MKRNQKILTVSTLKRKISAFRKQGKKIAFTNGCFDILHYGHVSYLQKAKRQDRILILGLNSDNSIKRIKGKSRPIIKEYYRASLLASLECIDYVVLFDEGTPYNLIKSLTPDILIKGADWKGKGVVGEDIVKDLGGKVEYIEYVENLSTTGIINDILKKCKK